MMLNNDGSNNDHYPKNPIDNQQEFVKTDMFSTSQYLGYRSEK